MCLSNCDVLRAAKHIHSSSNCFLRCPFTKLKLKACPGDECSRWFLCGVLRCNRIIQEGVLRNIKSPVNQRSLRDNNSICSVKSARHFALKDPVAFLLQLPSLASKNPDLPAFRSGRSETVGDEITCRKWRTTKQSTAKMEGSNS